MTNIIINEKSAGIPKSVNTPTVNTLIGITKFKGDAIKLYPYKTNALITTRFNRLNSFFNMFLTNKKYVKKIIFILLVLK